MIYKQIEILYTIVDFSLTKFNNKGVSICIYTLWEEKKKNLNTSKLINYIILQALGFSSLNIREYCSSTGFKWATAGSAVALTKFGGAFLS